MKIHVKETIIKSLVIISLKVEKLRQKNHLILFCYNIKLTEINKNSNTTHNRTFKKRKIFCFVETNNVNQRQILF